jgi:hypothetical protein
MNILRKLLACLFSLTLLISLLGLALTTSAKVNLSNESKTSSLLKNTSLYDNFVSRATTEADQALNSTQSSALNTELQQAIKVALPKSEFNKYVDQFVSSNYTWFKGNTTSPQFTIDLSPNKTAFATQLSNYVSQKLASLPECNAEQLLQIDAVPLNPLTLVCNPATVSSSQAVTLLNSEIDKSNVFLSNPVITAASLNASNNNSGRAYYQNISKAPNVYRSIMNGPYFFAGTAIISLGLVTICIRHRKKKWQKVVGLVVLLSGLVLLLLRLASSHILSHIDRYISKQQGIYEFKPALIGFVNNVEDKLRHTGLYFSLAYILIGLTLLLIYKYKSYRRHEHKRIDESWLDEEHKEPSRGSGSINLSPHRGAPVSADIINTKSQGSKLKTAPPLRKTKPPKRNRLIQ